MVTNNTLNLIMVKHRISNVLLSKLTNIHVTTICRYRNMQRNIGKKNIIKIYEAFAKLDVDDDEIAELIQNYESTGNKKVL